MTDIKLLPLPEWMAVHVIPDDGLKFDRPVYLKDRMEDYARANVEAGSKYYRDMLCQSQDDVMKLRDEAEALRAEVGRWRTEATEVANGAAVAIEQAETRAARLAKELQQAHKDFGCELRDPNGTIWEYAAGQKARAERMADALRLAEEHINTLTPEWYSAGQRVLAAIRAALIDYNQEADNG